MCVCTVLAHGGLTDAESGWCYWFVLARQQVAQPPWLTEEGALFATLGQRRRQPKQSVCERHQPHPRARLLMPVLPAAQPLAAADTNARLAVLFDGPGTLQLDMVSLLPTGVLAGVIADCCAP